MSTRTVEDRSRFLRQLDGILPHGLANVNRADLERAFDQRWSAWTLHTYWVHAWGFYRWADGTWLSHNPMAEMTMPPSPILLPRPCTTEQLEVILSKASEPYRTFAELASGAALRAGEIAGLDRGDVGERWVVIRDGKGNKQREAAAHPRIWRAIRDFPRGSIVEYLGGVADARWVSCRSWQHFHKITGEKIGLHRLRAWHATQMRNAGADVYEICAQLGHSSVATTMRYVQVRGEERLLRVAALPVPAAASC